MTAVKYVEDTLRCQVCWPGEKFLTVEDWWRRYEPSSIELLENPALAFFADAERLQTMCEERGIPFIWVKATSLLSGLGLSDVRAFPKWVIDDFYPINP